MSKEKSVVPSSPSNTKGSSFYYGYIIVLCSFLIMFICFGTNYSSGVFFNRLLADMHWSRAVTSVGYALAQFIGGLVGIITGRLGDRFGPRIVIMACIISLGAGCAMMSSIDQPWQFYILGMLVGVGFGGAAIPVTVLPSRWFIKHRGLMTGIVIAGIGTGTIVTPVVAEKLITAFQWRESFIIIGLIALVIGIPAAFFLKRDPSVIGLTALGEKEVGTVRKADRENGMTFKEAVRTRQFWVISFTCMFFGYCVQGVLLHIVPAARSLGIDSGIAAFIISFLGLGSILGRVFLGSLSDRIGEKNTFILALVLGLLSVLSLQIITSPWMFYIFGVVFGLGYGAVITLMTLMPARVFGLLAIGTLVGSITFIYTIGGSLGPILTGYIFDVTGSYRLAFVIFAILAVCAIIMASMLKPEIRKIDKDIPN